MTMPLAVDHTDHARGSEAGPGLGYVSLRDTPYRGHWLVRQAVLARTSPGDRILDCGTSTGYLARGLVTAGRRVDGAELDPVAAEAARDVCDFVWVGDISRLDPTELPHDYDLILFADTLEHLPDPPAVLRNLKRRLAPGATLVVSLPNVANWAIRLSLLGGRFRYTERGILDRTHLRFYTRNTALEMIEAGGFTVTSVVGSIPVPFVRSRTLGRLAHRIGNLRPSLFAYTFVITAEPTV
jgi:2-polyprenyl-3-methyl-5-hydroxy-6-metoxy-1,4-benzoquinol methylase